MARNGKQKAAAAAAEEAGHYEWDYLCKFILIGDSAVGKSALLLRITDDRFLAEEAEPTVGVEFGSVTIPLTASTSSQSTTKSSSPASASASSSSSPNAERVKIQIWDTAGSEAFRGITRSYFRGAAGCLVVYDVTHRPSYDNCRTWLKDVREHAEEDACIVLVGNRADLIEGEDGEARRKVKKEEAEKWADEQGILFIETSAKTGQNVHGAFEKCVTEIHRRFTAAQKALQEAGKPGQAAAAAGAPATVETRGANLLKSRIPPGGEHGSGSGGSDGGTISLDAAGVRGAVGKGCCCVM